ncbi:MAG TPA: permease-like cell division protein FtsX [Coxiellaceae bacterium]|nr:permease-like cell division protein FtsX [Coxiellaceae bacterium]
MNSNVQTPYHKNAQTNKYSSLTQFSMDHVRAFLFALGEIVKKPFANMLTLSVIGTVMSLPFGFYLLLSNFQLISQHWHGRPEISLYLKSSAPQIAIDQLIESLKTQPAIKSARYISPEEGLQSFEQFTQMKHILSHLSHNPLPGVISVEPQQQLSPQALNALAEQLKPLGIVDNVQVDSVWVKRLYYLVQIGERIFYTLTFIFSIGVVLIVGNTIRLIMQKHAQEILVMRLVGATKAFIRRPFLYRGFFYGLLGGILAWLLVSILLLWLSNPLQQLAQSYGSTLLLKGLNWETGLGILGISSVLGLMGSWVALRQHLKAPESV